MNKKQFVILLVVVLLAGAAGWMVYQRGNRSWESASQNIGGKLLPHLPVNDIAQITIQSGTNELVLARQDDLWRVRERDNYPADFSKISGSVMKLADAKIVQNESVGPSELGRFNLLPPGSTPESGTRVELKDQNGKTVASLLLGKDHMSQPTSGESWPDGRYVISGNDTQNVALISDTLDDLSPNPADWLDKSFFEIENPRSIAVTFPAATNSWKLTRRSLTNDWTLADAKPGEKLDPSSLDDVTSPFESPNFNDVSPGTTAPKDADIVTVKTLDGVAFTAKVWRAQNGDYSMTISAAAAGGPSKKEDSKLVAGKLAADKQFEGWTYDVPGYTVESLLKPRNQLLIQTNDTAAAKFSAEK